MRAVLRLKTSDSKLNRLSLEGFLQSEGYIVIDLVREKAWLELPDQELISDKIKTFQSQIFKLEALESEVFAYIYNENAEGLVSFNDKGSLFEIRLFRHNRDTLLKSCEKLVESLIGFFERDSTNLTMKPIGIREIGQSDDQLCGEVYKTDAEKIEKAKKDKSIEYTVGSALVIGAFISVGISFFANWWFGYGVESLNNWMEWAIYFVERIIGPLLITGSVLFYNYYKHKSILLQNKTVILWK